MTNMYMFSHTLSPFLVIRPTSTMNTVLGFEPGEIDGTVTTNPAGSTLTTNIDKGSFSITANTNDILYIVFRKTFNIKLDAGVNKTPASVVADINAKLAAKS